MKKNVLFILSIFGLISCHSIDLWRLSQKKSIALSETIIKSESVSKLLFLDEKSKYHDFNSFPIRIIDKTKSLRFCSTYMRLHNGNFASTYIIYDCPSNFNVSMYHRDITILEFKRKKNAFYITIGATSYLPQNISERFYYFVDIEIKENTELEYEVIKESVRLPNLSGLPHKYYDKQVYKSYKKPLNR